MSENPMEQSTSPNNNPGWEREVIEKLAFAAINEQKKTRRWGLFFKSLMFAYLIVLLGVAVYPKFKGGIGSSGKPHTAVIDVVGMISESEVTNATAIIQGLRNAAKHPDTKGIVIHANSPGGSPVQADYVFNEIRAIKAKHPDLPIYAVISDMCASGCYYIASAADKIFANPSSLVGSIGVIMNGFGFVGTMDKFGIERRLVIAGEHKALMDPFSPVNSNETKFMQTLIDQVHQQFIDAVKLGRGDRLKETPDMFSGLVWSGAEGIKLGLVDELGNDDYVAREIIGAKHIENFTKEERLLDRLVGKLGASFGHSIGAVLNNFSLQ
jgi:protease-4